VNRASLLAVLALSLTSFTTPPHQTVSVKFLGEPSRSTTISTSPVNGVLYVPLSDLASIFRLTARPDPEAQKIELRTEHYVITSSAANPYVTVTDEKQTTNVVQLPVPVLSQDGGFMIPIEYFTPILDYALTENVLYDRAARTISVGSVKLESRFDVANLSIEERSNGYLINIRCTKSLPDYESWLKPIGNDTWVYVTIANARADVAALNRISPHGFLKKLVVFQSPTSVQLTLKVKGEMNSAEVIPAQGSDDILVALRPATEEQIARRKALESQHSLERERSKWKLDVVVIDAGHGGKDPGTIGVTHTKEKDITLAIALKLGALLEKNLRNVRVVYTRAGDEFIELYRRGQIANEVGGKLFVSIHCNATPHKPTSATGFEIYLLRPGKTENALRIAERENSVVTMEEGYEKRYQQLTEENFILLTMAQSAYVKYSEKFADILQQEMGRHLEIENDGIKQAGFYVLVGASMPNVLVETAYLSNKHDEQVLKSGKGQHQIAQAIFEGIKRYKVEYEKSLEEGKSIGAREQ
jgi:N-acetylmuramoyl-L-alanine amidase